jgi:chorismate mutase
MIAIRGATTCAENTPTSILEATEELLRTIFRANCLPIDSLVSIIFTATPDITAAFPAAAARQLGLVDVPLLGAQEIGVPGAPELCIRVLLHANIDMVRSNVKHIYLRGAARLRPDLSEERPK